MSSVPGWQIQTNNLSSYGQVAGGAPTPSAYRTPSGSRVPAPPAVPSERIVTAPTLGQFWRSDSRVIPGRKPARWAGRAAFWLGLLALGAYLFDLFFVRVPAFGVAIAQPIGVVAFFFALIAIIAGVGRGLGILGLILSVASNIGFWSWMQATFGG